jgi:carbonic anhydrase
MTRSSVVLIILMPGITLLPGCDQEMSSDTVSGDVHWGYEGAEGPANWARLDPSFATCGSGVEQSPIDLTGSVPDSEVLRPHEVTETILTPSQRAHVMDIIDNGHTIQITNDIPMKVELEGTDYELVQYHFHAPSEHQIDGEHAPLEVHFVHQSAGGGLAVLGVLVEEGAHDPLWEFVLAELPDGPDDERHLEDLDLELEEFLPLPKRYYRYEGSLTTPPCSEGVHWAVMAEKRQISAAQMAEIVSHLHDNNRPVQPLGNRALRLVSEE